MLGLQATHVLAADAPLAVAVFKTCSDQLALLGEAGINHEAEASLSQQRETSSVIATPNSIVSNNRAWGIIQTAACIMYYTVFYCIMYFICIMYYSTLIAGGLSRPLVDATRFRRRLGSTAFMHESRAGPGPYLF